MSTPSDAVFRALVEALAEPIAERVAQRLASALPQAAPAAPAEQPQREWFSTKEAAKYLNVSTSTLDHWRIDGKGPRYAKTGRMVRYKRDALDAFLRERA